MYEVKALMDYSYYSHKDEWEQTRFISYVIAQVNSQKKLKMEDIVSFDWDENKKVHITSISNEDIERLKNKAKEYLNNG